MIPTISKVALEDRSRVKEPLLTLLNQQIVNELYSANLYKAIACWMDGQRRFKFSKIFLKYGQEELVHMDKVIEFLFERNAKVVIGNGNMPVQDFSSVRDVFEKSLEHEISVTANWEVIANKAKETGDNTVYHWCQWFLGEQREEEEKFRNALFALDNMTPDWYLEFNWETIIG